LTGLRISTGERIRVVANNPNLPEDFNEPNHPKPEITNDKHQITNKFEIFYHETPDPDLTLNKSGG
jgi:hypothetical protein